jgi:hypothetical protein
MTIHSRSSHPHYEPLHLPIIFLHYLAPCPCQCNVAHRRFLKARGYNASQAKQMILECIQWRRTVEDVGIEELYRTIDPFDVRSAPSLLHSFFPCVFRSVSDLRRSLLPHSFPDGGVSLSAGQWVSIRYAPRLASPSRNAHMQNQMTRI